MSHLQDYTATRSQHIIRQATAMNQERRNAPVVKQHSESHEQHKLKKIVNLRYDFERAIKRAQATLHGRMESIKSRLSSTQQQTFFRLSDTLSVQFVQPGRTTMGSDSDEPILDRPDHNYSPCLVLGSLEDGKFTARLPLHDLPSGDVTIRVRNFQLEIIRNKGARSTSLDVHHLVTKPCKLGEIDLPIYIDPSTLRFTLAVNSRELLVEANTKCFCGTRISLSDTDVSSCHGAQAVLTATAPLRRKLYTQQKSLSSQPASRDDGEIDDEVFVSIARDGWLRRKSHPCGL